jgi:signal transduction histidine kinase/CheY-like chemotaxis protein
MPDQTGSTPVTERRIVRERGARKQAEQLLEQKSRELYLTNRELQEMALNLENLVDERTDELKVARDEAMAASHAKSAFLANISHEIRTPMSSIIGMAELVLHSPMAIEQRQHVQLILDSARSLLTIINDILDISKLESGKFQLEVEEFDLFELLDNVVEILGIQASDKRLEIGAIPANGLPARVIGDPVRLRQILLNLLGNAVKFTSHGEVRLRVEVDDYSGDRVRLFFEVEDTGPGISPEHQDSLFDKFSQVEGGHTRRHHGTGLGLAISKNLVECMEGEINFQSQPSQGSCFWFKVMLKIPEVTLSADHSPARGKSVALLTTNPFLSESVPALLSSLGAEVSLLADLESLHAVRERERAFDLLLVDHLTLCEIDPDLNLRQAIERHGSINTVLLNWINSTVCDKLGSWATRINRPLTRRKLMDILTPVVSPGSHAYVSKGGEGETRVRRILLAEDVPALQLVMKAILERQGYTVDIANDGNEAIEAVRSQDYGMILMDIQMPEVDGISAAREIRMLPDPSKASIPIIALTANAMKGDQDTYLVAGMNDYLSKPVDNRKLDEALMRWFVDTPSK